MKYILSAVNGAQKGGEGMWIAIVCFLIYIVMILIARSISKMERFSKGFEVSDTDLKNISKWSSFSWFGTLLESVFFASLLTWIDSAFENVIYSFLFYFVMYFLMSIVTGRIFNFLDKKKISK